MEGDLRGDGDRLVSFSFGGDLEGDLERCFCLFGDLEPDLDRRGDLEGDRALLFPLKLPLPLPLPEFCPLPLGGDLERDLGGD